MATLCRAYPSEEAARRAVEGLRAEGLPPQNVHLIMGSRSHDLRHEPAGEFAKTVEPNAPVGTFGSTHVPRWRPGGGFAGHPDEQREGSFADADSLVVVRCDATGQEHARVCGARELVSLFADAGLEERDAGDAVEALHGGEWIVLVQVASGLGSPFGLAVPLASGSYGPGDQNSRLT
jgi:hypothetical protein